MKADRRNVTSPGVAAAVTATGAEVQVAVNRLRATWLVALMCSPVPLAVLLRAAGLRSARSLVDLLSHCPAADDEQVARLLAGPPTPAAEPGGERRGSAAVSSTARWP